MTDMTKDFWVLFDEASAARAHFHTWWALSNLARPEFYSTMNNHSIVDFFHVAHDGNYKLFFVALAKFFDRDPRVVGISHFRSMLREKGRDDIAGRIEDALTPLESDIRKILNIRNQTISHNDSTLPRENVYEINGITPDRIRQLIDVFC